MPGGWSSAFRVWLATVKWHGQDGIGNGGIRHLGRFPAFWRLANYERALKPLAIPAFSQVSTAFHQCWASS
jgi:hypothetical protein